MRIEFNKPSSLSRTEVIANILAIENQIIQSGSVDSEKNNIDSILEKLKQDKITPQRAMELVKDINDSRQDYH